MVPSANQRNDPKRGNRRNNRGQGYRRNDHPDNWRKSNPDNRTNISSRGNLIPSVPVEARAEPSFASMTEEEQLYYAIKMSLEGPAHERAMAGSESEQRYFHPNQENSSRREFTDNGNYRSSHFQEKRDAQRGQKNRERRNEWSQGSSARGNEYYQEESRPCPSFRGGRQGDRNGIKHQNLSFHTDRRFNNVNDDTGFESQKVEKGQFSSEKKYNINPNRQFGYRELDDMLQNFEPSIIIKLLNSEKKQFEMLLLKEMNFDWYYLIISLLAKLCKSDVPELHQSLFLDLLVMVKRSGFLAKLPSQIAVISTGKKIPNEKVVELHKSLVSFFQTFMDKSSTSACDSVPEKYFEGIVKMESLLSINRYEVPQDVYADLAVLQLRLDDARKNFVGKNDDNTGKQLRRMAYVEELSHRPPPNDFRELNVVPTFEDVNYEEEPFVRAALVDRPYKSIDDYLDVQFRLLREDFFSPLRSGIQEYRNLIKDRKKNRSKINNIRIYRDVKFVDYDIVSGSYIIAFSKKGLARVTWENSKRLMHGSLLCLSKDDFSSGIFATVAKRDTKALSEKGIIHVRIEETENSEGYTNGSFIMAESSVYFEAYRNVLYVLQNYTEKNFPLMEIVLGQVTVSHLPDYLSIAREQHVDTTYNLSALVQPTYYRQSANILELDRVMTPGDLNLDKNQFEAFKLALTEKVAIIHGPPGTGKTFIGLKVVQTLLANHHIWRINEVSQSVKSPILIVCYTNHALDQFLEGILRFTTDVVRIGGMSKSEAIKACNLSEIRKKCKGRLNTAIDRRFLYEKRQELRDLTSKLHEENCLIKLVGKKIVLHESELLDRDVIPPKLLGSFNQYGQKDERSGMARWLCVNEIPLLKSALEGLEKLSATSQEAQGPLDTEDKQEEEDEIDSLERTIAEPQNVGDSVDDFVSTVEGLKRTTTASGISFRFVWSEELANEDVRELEQILETKNISEAEYNSAVAELERHKESTRLILKILEAIPPVSQDSLQSVINSASRGFTLLPLHERWILYGRWRQDILDELMKKRDSLERRYQRLREQINDLSVEEDALYCATMDIVAATTSGCAKYNKLVRHLAPKIGDHQQLRPSTSSYKLAKDFNLDVSMFERFIELGMKHVTLSLQHRMRPEVARLIAPAIYESLENDSSVLDYLDVKGVKQNVFFLAHEVLEKADNEQKSHLNPHEAEISLNLARYLIQQGYLPSQITVLTTYSGQLLYMLQLRKRSFESLSGVKITVVDNYQGEENDIIILSLVRSNIDAKIGFLAIENRVCVALSRAKQGLYMIGNMGSLDSKSKLWKSIHKTLDENNEIGPQLELVCQIHGTETKIKCPNDFNAVIEGGCTEKCNAVLRCGHICPSMCHIQDRDHLVKRCTKPCERYVCIKKHRCPKKCFENCGNCMVKLDKELPCGHVVKLPCYVNELDYKCVVLVEKMLPDCGHIGRVHCAVDPKGHPCSIPCDFRLYCGHSCERKCHVNIVENSTDSFYLLSTWNIKAHGDMALRPFTKYC
ncbi:hypothetical protein QYM36_018158 [Artemia franciscana]|uniref:NFX1-type zinc finger-containing protein 1 n=1 Tax=Artemia franciscana TaxID=6661 RepID=A0AA88H786_ARTSF|nr:hypothetical protein QYM36_018158 [Artemia franciscana]KAK2703370.1 hypothetical protein QYM36_018158 [Artemia franciscana]